MMRTNISKFDSKIYSNIAEYIFKYLGNINMKVVLRMVVLC